MKILFQVKIKNPILKTKNDHQEEDMYKPWTSSQFNLILSEPTGDFELVDESLRPDLACLKNIPIRDHNDFYYIEDIILDEKNKINQEANLLFCVRKVKSV